MRSSRGDTVSRSFAVWNRLVNNRDPELYISEVSYTDSYPMSRHEFRAIGTATVPEVLRS